MTNKTHPPYILNLAMKFIYQPTALRTTLLAQLLFLLLYGFVT